MKVDRNQDVRPMLVALTARTFDGKVREEYQHSGGIPLRLEIASRLVSANIASGIYEVRNRLGMPGGCTEISEAMLDFADTLIDAHNATCGEVASE